MTPNQCKTAISRKLAVNSCKELSCLGAPNQKTERQNGKQDSYLQLFTANLLLISALVLQTGN